MNASSIPIEYGANEQRTPTPEQIDAFLAATEHLVAEERPEPSAGLLPILALTLFGLALWGAVVLAETMRSA